MLVCQYVTDYPVLYPRFRPNLLTSIAPRCQGTVGSIVGLVPGVISLSPGESVAGAHQGRHSKSSQYRRMKAEWKTNVYLARSRIQVRRLDHLVT